MQKLKTKCWLTVGRLKNCKMLSTVLGHTVREACQWSCCSFSCCDVDLCLEMETPFWQVGEIMSIIFLIWEHSRFSGHWGQVKRAWHLIWADPVSVQMTVTLLQDLLMDLYIYGQYKREIQLALLMNTGHLFYAALGVVLESRSDKNGVICTWMWCIECLFIPPQTLIIVFHGRNTPGMMMMMFMLFPKVKFKHFTRANRPA